MYVNIVHILEMMHTLFYKISYLFLEDDQGNILITKLT